MKPTPGALALFCLAGGMVFAAPTERQPLDPVFLSPGLWEMTASGLETALAGSGFRWTSDAKTSLRASGAGLRLAGLEANEAIVHFRGDRPVSAVVVLYNRGDAGDLDRAAFERLLADAQSGLAAAFGRPGNPTGRDASSAVRAEGLEWTGGDGRKRLEWSATRESRAKGIPFRAEFIRLTLEPPGVTETAIGAASTPSAREGVKAFRGRDMVVTEPDGAVMLTGIPMVDQGEKGYCVVATVERVMRYFGATVDQHELAQIANTQSGGGTSPTAMLEALKKLTMRLGVKVRDVQAFDFRDFLKMVEDYNRAAKRERKPLVDLGGRVVDLDACYRQMDPALLREVRLRKQADFGRFQREIQRSISNGIPPLWSVQLGLVPEPGLPQASGGHMRLIVGFDPASGDLFYSDSWGAGHERKRMSAADAWTITTGLATLQPAGT